MSDCFTETMEPKEPLGFGMCDTCIHCKSVKWACEEGCFGGFPLGYVVNCGSYDQEKDYKQRYQQLEQVACEMYAIAITTWMEVRFLAGPQMKRSVESREEHLSRLKEQLEALGVSLDD